MKVVKDGQGEKVATVQSNHGCLKFFGTIFAICIIIGLFTGSAGWQGIVGASLMTVLVITGTIIRKKRTQNG
jgi:hypothetical protein